MTGNDAEILCGEWQTGDTPPASSGERYNIVLNILEIIRHPGYNSSSYLVNDVAVFIVNDLHLHQVHIFLVVLLQYVGTWFPWFQGHPLISGAMPLESGAGFA